MDDLAGALRQLAREAAPPAPADPAALWQRGRSRVRRRRLVAAAAVAALAAVVFSATFAVAPSSGLVPATTQVTHGAAVPRNVYPARSWYPTTADEPPGVLAVVGGLIRDGRTGLFGISATTGDYRLLDLPRRAVLDGENAAALSPDGRHLAYWITGSTAGEPLPTANEDLPVGLAVYDTVTGRTERYLPETEHGLSADGLVWIDNDVVALTFGQRTSTTASVDIGSWAWRPFGNSATGRFAEPTRMQGKTLFLPDTVLPRRPYGVLVATGDRTFAPLGWDGADSHEFRLTLPRLSGASWTDATTSPAFVVAGVHQDAGTDELRAGRLGADGTVSSLTVLPGVDPQGFIGWLSDSSILVAGRPVKGDSWGSLYAVDLTTSVSTRLGTADGGMVDPGLAFATDLLRNPLVAGVKPPTVDPRWKLAGGAAGLVLLGALGVPYLLRRRRG